MAGGYVAKGIALETPDEDAAQEGRLCPVFDPGGFLLAWCGRHHHFSFDSGPSRFSAKLFPAFGRFGLRCHSTQKVWPTLSTTFRFGFFRADLEAEKFASSLENA